MRKQLGKHVWPAIAAAAVVAGSANYAAAAILTARMGDGSAASAGAMDTWIVLGPAPNVNTDPNNTNSGVDPKLRVRTYSGTNGQRNILLAWPSLFGSGAGQIPLGAKIQSATLELTATNTSQGSTWIEVGMLKRAWNEGNGNWSIVGGSVYGVTWNNAKTFSDGTASQPWATAGAAGATDITLPSPVIRGTLPGNNKEDWDITSFAQAWSDGALNAGVMLWTDPASGGSNNEFIAKENTTDPAGSAGYAMLSVNYSVPEPAMLGLLGGFAVFLGRRRH